MPMPIARIAAPVARLRTLVPAWAAVALAALIEHPLALLPLLLAQSLFLAAAAVLLGRVPAQAWIALIGRRVPALLVFLAAEAALVALLVGTPLARLSASRAGADALLLSVGVVLAVLALWRLWPAFGLALLWDDAHPPGEDGARVLNPARRALAYALQLTRAPELYFGSGLAVSIALVLMSAGAVLLAGFGPALPDELTLLMHAGYGLLLAPLASLLVTDRTAALLRIDADDFAAPAEPATADPAAAPTPAPDPRRRDALLRAAAAEGRVEEALALLEAGASPEALPAPDELDQRSLAVIAAVAPDTRLLRALIARGADVNRAVGGLTPLLAAARDSYHGRPEAVMMLVANGAAPDVADADGNTPLHHAALTREPAVAAILLDAGADHRLVNRAGLTPLGVAASTANEALLRCLIARGARPDEPRAHPALIAACEGGEDAAAIVKLLLKHKADPCARDALQRTALHAAALHGHADCVELLLAAGTPVDARDRNGVTALMDAARAGANRVLQRLVFAAPDARLTDAIGRSALTIACQSRRADEETVRLLLTLGADPAQVGADGRRPVEHAIALGRWPIVALLDPEFTLPSALAAIDAPGEPPLAETDRATLLARALKLGRMTLVEELLALEPAIGADELERAWFALAADLGAPPRAFERLLAAGLACDAGGRALLDVSAALRPLPLAALEALLARGATPGAGPLLIALTLGGEARAEALALELLARGADLAARDGAGASPLHHALERGWVALARALIERGADPNATDARGRTPISLLPALPDDAALPLAAALLRAGADPERAAPDGRTAGGLALAGGRAALARLLCWHGSFRHPGRRLREADLPAAAQAGDAEAVRRLLELGLPVDARDAQGSTALLRACGAGRRELALMLLDAGADPEATAASGMSCLAAAAAAGRVAVIELLLDRGVAPDARIAGGGTPLMVAAARGQIDAVRCLLARRADAGAIDERGNGALHAAAQFAFDSQLGEHGRELLRLLLEAGAPPDQANADGQTPLLVLLGARARPTPGAPRRGLGAALQLLLARGADVTAQDQRGVSALHALAMHGQIDLLDALRRAGADPALKDRLGRSAHEVAVMLGYVDVAGELKRLARPAPRPPV